MNKNLKHPRAGKSAIYKALSAAFVLAVAATTTHAAPTEYSYTGANQTWTVTTTGLYDIQALGAQGGGALGGLGAAVGSFFSLSAGHQLRIVVGGQGGDRGTFAATGGGGASFVYDITTSSLLIEAGGGGGSYSFGGTEGGNGSASFGGSGNGGAAHGRFGAGGGGGFNSAGGSGNFSFGGGGFNDPYGGGNRPGVGSAGGIGGFGGGGAGLYAGGGGGGFTGGDGGSNYGGGGGGSSFASGTVHLQTDGARSGDGLVTIELTSAPSAVPEPETLSLFGLGLGALMLRRRRAGAEVKPDAAGSSAADDAHERRTS